ncbi:PAB-dependent poly(A)-specific ribonuclease subunit 3 [Ascosphaera acerosa]|nr:PAB-dependent poly(A)-specific ribonuclease subunit 3 [Ascosphaera acerosa]
MNPLNPNQAYFANNNLASSSTNPLTPSAPSTPTTKKRLNVDSPSFTPSTMVPGVAASFGNSSTGPSSPILKKAVTAGTSGSSISPKAAHAAPFTPRALTRTNTSTGSDSGDWASVANVKDFVPQGLLESALAAQQVDQSLQHHTQHVQANGSEDVQGATGNGMFGHDANLAAAAAAAGATLFNPYSGTATPLPVVTPAHAIPNPYAHDHTVAGNVGGATFFGASAAFAHPAQYHLYAPVGPRNQNILSYQRNVHDLFLPNDLRETIQKRSAAALQVLPNSTLPAQVDHFHSLVPLDLSQHKNATIFGYPSWVYKAQSSKDGCFYTLRRLEGFRLTSEKAIRSVQNWKRVCNGSVVSVHDAFTNRQFGDSSLIFVYDYHPLSTTLADHHLGGANRFTPGRHVAPTHIPEQTLWSYVTQIASALKAIHSAGLAARIIDPSKILLTGKNRIRLSACAIHDVVQHDAQRPLAELQNQDLISFGQLILTLGANSQAYINNSAKAMEHFARAYTPQMKNSIWWLLGVLHPDPAQERSINTFVQGISNQLISTFDSALHMDDQLMSDLSREVENGRLFRLMAKLNFITERPEYEHDVRWSEIGERYLIKLFRDYVFHQVDATNAPVVDLGHVLICLNKLDAGIEEKVMLVSRDEQNCFVVSYKELKKAVESSFQALMKFGRR